MRRRIRLSGGPRRRAQPAAAAGNGVHISMAMASPPQAATSERDLRLDLFRGVALWLIFLDHIPENVVNWFTIRNYGFSDATEIFIFISGYTAAFVYGRTMRERGFMLSSARILRRASDLCRAYFSVHHLHGGDRLRRGDLRQSAVRRGNENPRFSQAARHHHLSSAVAEVQAGQHGRAAALHRAAAHVSADAVSAVAGTERGAGRIGRGLRVDVETGLEPAGLSERRLVLQSVPLAIAVRVRCLVRARRLPAARRLFTLAHRAGRRHRLPGLRLRHNIDVALRGAGPFRADLAGGVDVSHRQDQSRRAALRAFPGAGGGDDPLHPAALVRPEIGDPATRHPLRSALARDFLPRRVSGLCRAIHYRRILRRPAATDGRQRVRHYHYDRYRQPYIVVQGHRRSE